MIPYTEFDCHKCEGLQCNRVRQGNEAWISMFDSRKLEHITYIRGMIERCKIHEHQLLLKPELQ
jgi:hypothetical protein